MVDSVLRHEVVQRHLHKDNWAAGFCARIGVILTERTIEHFLRDIGYGTERAALDDDRLAKKHLGGLDNFSFGSEHDRIGEPVLQEFQAHQTVIDSGECGPREFRPLHFA